VAPSNPPKVANAVANAGAWANRLPKHLKQGDKVGYAQIGVSKSKKYREKN
jgi:hypothetical protein